MSNRDTWTDMKSKLSKMGFAANVIIGDPVSPPEKFTMAIVPNNGQVDETTLTYTRDIHRVIIRCYADRLAESAEETEFKLDEIREKIAIDFFGDFDLGGTVAYALPTEFAWEYDYVEVGARKYRVMDVMFGYRVDDRAAFG